MAVSWPCRLSVEEYAAAGAAVVVPRPDCPECGRPMIFAGSYWRRVRHGGGEHRVLIRQARCEPCGDGHALLPDFVLHRRRDSASAVGAALLGAVDPTADPAARRLYAGVPARTVRSWRARFCSHAAILTSAFAALTVTLGSHDPRLPLDRGATTMAIAATGAVWLAASHRRPGQIPTPWRLVSIITGGTLLAPRVDMPLLPRQLPRPNSGKASRSAGHRARGTNHGPPP